MNNRFKKLLTFALLALQLVMGVPSEAARADVESAHLGMASASGAVVAMHGGNGSGHAAHTQMTGGHEEDCPMHAGGTNKRVPARNHDCCHVGVACQCHGVYTPVSLNLPVFADILPALMLKLSSAPVVPTRIDEFLRPPIA